MPIYEYECGQCDHHLEALQKISESPLVYCPECGEAALRKKVSAAAFRLKGTGWYETDFKNDGSKKKVDAENGKNQKPDKGAAETNSGGKESANANAAGTETSSSAKTESKPAQKSGKSSGSNKPRGGASSGGK